MAGSAASEGILFIGAIVAATAFVGVFSGVANQFSETFSEKGSLSASNLAADITILNDPENVPTSPLTAFVKNTGSTTLYSADASILIDGQVATNVTLDVLGETDDTTWPPGTVLEMQVNDLTAGSGDHRMRVVVGHGVDDNLPFRVA